MFVLLKKTQVFFQTNRHTSPSKRQKPLVLTSTLPSNTLKQTTPPSNIENEGVEQWSTPSPTSEHKPLQIWRFSSSPCGFPLFPVSFQKCYFSFVLFFITASLMFVCVCFAQAFAKTPFFWFKLGVAANGVLKWPLFAQVRRVAKAHMPNTIEKEKHFWADPEWKEATHWPKPKYKQSASQ